MQIKDKLPHNIIEAMSKSSNKEFADGYVRFLSEEEITEIESIVKKSYLWNDGIPFATTVFGDVISWEKGYVMLYKFTDENYNVLLSGTEFLFENFEDKEYQKDYFDMELYLKAIKKCGKIAKDKCYVLEPIPKLGGARDIEYVNIGSINEYIRFLIQI